MKIEVGLSQLENTWPGGVADRHAVVAIAPKAAPRAKGVRIDENEKSVSIRPEFAIVGRPARMRMWRPEHDPQQRDEQDDGECRGDRAERLRVGGPEHRQDEDQPHVVGLPNRSHRMVSELPHPIAALAASSEQLPKPGAEVAAREPYKGRPPRARTPAAVIEGTRSRPPLDD